MSDSSCSWIIQFSMMCDVVMSCGHSHVNRNGHHHDHRDDHDNRKHDKDPLIDHDDGDVSF